MYGVVCGVDEKGSVGGGEVSLDSGGRKEGLSVSLGGFRLVYLPRYLGRLKGRVWTWMMIFCLRMESGKKRGEVIGTEDDAPCMIMYSRWRHGV